MAGALPVIRAKVVLLGAPGVGKTSLVRRFVHSVFSDDYRSTLGVKVDRKMVAIEHATVTMLLWDIHGETTGLDVPENYLRGTSASIAVFDASRPPTIETAATLQQRVSDLAPGAFLASVGNKADLDPDWDVVDKQRAAIVADEHRQTSAKSGAGVEELFVAVAQGIQLRIQQKRDGA